MRHIQYKRKFKWKLLITFAIILFIQLETPFSAISYFVTLAGTTPVFFNMGGLAQASAFQSSGEDEVSKELQGKDLEYIKELMKKAIRLYRDGRRQEATRLYSEIKKLSKEREERLEEAETKERRKLEEKKREEVEAAKDKLNMKISLDYKNADLLTILRSLSWTYKLNIVTSPDIKGKVTISLQDVTVKKALEAIITISGLTYTIRDDIIYISPGDAEVVELTAEVIFLKYTKAADAQNLLRKTISGKGDIKIDEVANSLIVTDYPANIQKVKGLLEKIDIPPRQVLIEARIVDITSTDLEALGVKWNLKYSPGEGLFTRSTNYPEEIDATIDMAAQSDLSGSQIRINDLKLKGLTIDATLDALVKEGKANILASPSIAVLNGKEARIIIGERYPYKERTQTTTGTTETTKFVDIGITLRVTPQINEDGYITMNVHPEVSSLHTALAEGPRITTREADTTVRVKDGETLIIGGLIKQTEDASEEKIPLLGDIPLLGFLFKRREHDIERKELAVFITPKILYSREEREYLSRKDVKRGEVYVTLTKTAELIMVEGIFDQAKALDKGYGVESARKDKSFRKSQALSLYEHIYYTYPDSMRAPEALYSAGRIYYRDLKNYKRAKEAFTYVISDYPNTPFAEKAQGLYEKIEKIEKRNAEKKKK